LSLTESAGIAEKGRKRVTTDTAGTEKENARFLIYRWFFGVEREGAETGSSSREVIE